jgi:cytidylate kinase
VGIRISADLAPGWVRDRLAGLTGTRWVGVDGFGASGKSTLARRIAEVLPGSVIIGIDDFSRGRLSGWDRELFTTEVVEPLLGGRVARYRRWDLLADMPLGWAEVAVGVPVIVEGVSATDVRVGVPWDVTLWVDTPAAVRRTRILSRDDPVLLERWRTDWWPSELAYAQAQNPQDRVDAIVTSAAHGARPSTA